MLVTQSGSRTPARDPAAAREGLGVRAHAGVGRDTRVQADLLAGRHPTVDGSALKVLWSRDRAAKGELAVALLDAGGMLSDEDAERGGNLQTLLLNRFWASIGGGTDEVHRTMIGERGLGLPAEPRADRDVPFRDLP